jgi:hypothetical protein
VQSRLAVLDRSQRRTFPLTGFLSSHIVDAALAGESGIDRDDVIDGVALSVATGKIPHAVCYGRFAHIAENCVSAWNKDPVFGVIGIQSGL